MSLWNEYVGVLKKYVVFSGRASRHEFWSFVLVNLIISAVLGFVDPNIGSLYSLAVFLPSFAVGVRRLHDTNRSGWWLLIGLVPLIGLIVLIVFYATKGTAGANRYDGSLSAPAV